jgi:hypothetical protein
MYWSYQLMRDPSRQTQSQQQLRAADDQLGRQAAAVWMSVQEIRTWVLAAAHDARGIGRSTTLFRKNVSRRARPRAKAAAS